MPPTLRRITAIASLGLRVLAGERALDRPVRWVAVSELEDPTPFLEGGELLLTTGMRLGPGDAVPYLSRLVARGISGLGLGVGLSHEQAPESFVTAAEAAGMPLLEVPPETSFIAVGKAVSDLLAAEQYAELRRAFAAQGRLTRAALRPDGVPAVVDRTAAELGGWALLLDATGAVRHAAGGTGRRWAERRAAQLRAELDRLRATPAASLALASPEEHVVVRPLGARRRIRGFFAVGTRQALSPMGHTVVNTAGSLLTLAMEQGRGQHAARRRLRTAVLRLLLAGRAADAAAVLEPLGERLPDGPLAVLVCAGEETALLEAAGGRFAAPLAAPDGGAEVVVLVPQEEAEAATAALTGAAQAVGVGSPVPLAEVPRGLDQARRALAAARRAGAPVRRFPELAGQGLSALLDPAATAAFADALLAPLRAHGSRADLIGSLRAYLECNGHWDAAASRLGVHRHTLRYRMRRVGELLGRDLDDPGVRAELWIALTQGG